jgi:hypothetical protein
MPKPQPRNNQNSQRARQLFDQRQNWAFSDYNDLNGTDSAAALDGSQPGTPSSEDKSVSLVERYYQRLGRKQPIGQARSLKDAFDSAKEYATHDEQWDPSSSGFLTDKRFLKQLDAFGASARKNKDQGSDDNAAAANLFGDTALPDQSAATEAQQRRDAFQKILNPNFVAAPVKSSLNPVYSEQFGQPASLATSPAPTTATTVRRNPLNVSNPLLVDPTAVALRSSAYDNPTATALGLPTPPAFRQQAQPMTLEKMQSMVDPMAVFKKRNF